MSRSLFYIILLSIACVSVSFTALDKEKMKDVTLDQLFTSPDRYQCKKVVTEGFFFHGWEVIVLCESLEYSGYAEEHLVPAGRLIWVEGEIPQDVYDGLNEQETLGPEERFGFVRVIGKFEFGGQYGHNGGYDSQIIPFKIELLSAAAYALNGGDSCRY
jgi:hypothetical protein